jgi:nucleotide-binding universal stress UspA family protein
MTTASWQAVVIGVDTSPSAVDAVRVGWTVAEAAGVPCRLVHATPEAWTLPTAPHTFAMKPDAINAAAREAARIAVVEELRDKVPPGALAALDIRTGRAAAVLQDASRELQAGVVVLGGKHHSLLGRWVVGSTAHALVRAINVPVLVSAHTPLPIKTVLVAVDLSDAVAATIQTAEQYAKLFGAALHVIHIVEPLPVIPDTPLHFNDEELFDRSREHLEQHVWPLVTYPGATTGLRRGLSAEGIAAEAHDRSADLVVLGSHGKGWVDRILIGSVTERVLSALPSSVLVVPVTAPPETRPDEG